jgi:hypothetical protein
VRRVGGFIQAAFAAFWLGRASLTIGDRAEDVLIAVFGVAVIGVISYAIRVMADTALRPAGPEASRIKRSVTVAILWNAPPSQSTESMFGGNPRRWRPRPSCGLVSLGFHRTYTVIELVAAFVLPVVVIAAGHSDWVLPSIVITIGPLLLWLDHLVHIPGTAWSAGRRPPGRSSWSPRCRGPHSR